jgi:hypothetical protein
LRQLGWLDRQRSLRRDHDNACSAIAASAVTVHGGDHALELRRDAQTVEVVVAAAARPAKLGISALIEPPVRPLTRATPRRSLAWIAVNGVPSSAHRKFAEFQCRGLAVAVREDFLPAIAYI